MDQDGLKDQYLTRLHVAMRESSSEMMRLTQLLNDFAAGFLARLKAHKDKTTDPAGAQVYLEACEALKADFDVWVAHMAFANLLELRAMYENLDYWEQKLLALPSLPV